MSKTIIEQPQSVSSAFDELLNKMYISNVQNRLRQLNEPTDNDCKRWIWELIQNAKDSISQDINRASVDIKIIVREKKVQFKHNGSPFTAKAQLGLLYKYSEGKVNNSESTGRFGTGFLTTHTLSKTVSIEGDVYKDDTTTTLCGFSATMHRDGIDEPELLAGVERMKKGMIYTQETNGWTTYTYHLKTPQNENALKLGIENFISNIAQTMLFCKEIASIQLDDNGKITEIIRGKVKPLDESLFLSEFFIKGENEYNRKFIHTSIKKANEELAKRFKKERSIRLTACVEVDEDNNIVENLSSPSLFCVLPLVGSEKHIMPIYLNSPDFEPDSERESLILIGEHILADKGVISEGGINRMILKESIALYENIVSFLTKNKYKRLYLLIKGLKDTPNFEKNFNKKWFKEAIITEYRNIVQKYDIVETSVGNQKIFNDDGTYNIIIPKDGKEEIQTKIYDLSKDLFTNKIPLECYAKGWSVFAWDECGIFKIKNLCEYIDEKGCINNLPISSLDKFEWQNRFIEFIKNNNESLFKEYRLIPNRYGNFVSLEEDNFAEAIDITDYAINCLKGLGEDLNPLLLNKQIDTINLAVKLDNKTFASKINDKITEIIDEELSINDTLKGLVPLLKTIPNDDSLYGTEFVDKQKNIYRYINDLFPELLLEEERNNDIHKLAWRTLNTWCIDNLIKTVSEYECIDSLSILDDDKISWINNFIAFVSKEIKEGVLDEYAIIPNQDNVFCYKENLARDINIPKELKTKQAEKFGLLLKEKLLHEKINSISISKEFDINKVVNIINEIFTDDNFENNLDELDFALFLIHLLPDKASNILYKSQNDLLEITKKYYYERSKPYQAITINCSTEDLWAKANKKIISSLTRHIEEDKTLDGLKEFLSESGKEYDNGDTIIFLNDYYDYLKNSGGNISGNIIPNQKGVFFSLDDDFYQDDNIPELLKNVLVLVNSEEDFRNILAEKSLSDSAQPTHSKSAKDISTVIDENINHIYKESPRNWENSKFKEAINLLMIEWFPQNKEKAKDYFPHIYKKKETIEMNVLWSLEERQRMQKARSINPKLLDEFIENTNEIESLKDKKDKLVQEIEQLKLDFEKKSTSSNLNEIANEFPDITAEKIRELLHLEERMKEGWNLENTSEVIAHTHSFADIEEAIEQGHISPSFFHMSRADYEKRKYVEGLISRSVNNVIAHLNTLYGYDCTNHYQIASSVIGGITKNGNEITVVARPSDNDEVLVYYTSEFDVLEYVDAEFWCEDGVNTPKQITFGYLLKSTGINRIPIKNRTITDSDIETLLNNAKSDTFDFNAVPSDPYTVARIISSFANTNGGTLIFGLKKINSTSNEVVGLSSDFRVIEIVKEAILLLSPIPAITYDWMTIKENQIFVIKTEKSNNDILFRDKKYVRRGLSSILEEEKFKQKITLNNPTFRKTIAIIIAIEDYYPANGIQKVKYAKEDALKFREMLVNKMNVAEEDIIIYINEEALKNNLEYNLQGLFLSLTKDDRLIFYYAGHGFHDGVSNYLSTYDMHKSNISETAVSLRKILLDPLLKSKCQNALIFIDACAQCFKNEYERNLLSDINDEELILLNSDLPNYAIFLSCQFGQSSYSCDNLKNGIWTHHLVHALNGNVEGVIHSSKYLTDRLLSDYLSLSVSAYAKKEQQKEQNPKSILDSSHENVIIEII